MKKWAVLLTAGVFLSGCAELNSLKKQIVPANFSEKDLMGKPWLCKASYDMWNYNTEESYEFLPNGKVKNYGTLTTLGAVPLKYKAVVEGSWYLNGWHLAEKVEKYTFKRNFDAKMKKALAADPQLREKEKQFYEQFSALFETSAKSDGYVYREIETLTPNELTTKAGTSYVICAR